MNSNFYRVCVDRYVVANKEFVITDCLHNSINNINKARCKMLKLLDDAISVKSLRLEFEEVDDNTINVFSIDGDTKLYHVTFYISEVVMESDERYKYRDFDIFKNNDNWFIRSDKSGVISYKPELNEALLYIDYICAVMKNIEILNKYMNFKNIDSKDKTGGYNMSNKDILCEYDDFIIFKDGDKYYYKESNSEEIKEVSLVRCISLEENKSDDELLNPEFDFDISGELFNDPYYCYWKFL